ncbi:MAG: hypothetical protein KDA96_05220, partial [Planctomycetaceae bacterium]|nr:hypothetical protein [Planctomycetaceae bacterium]
MLRRHGRWSPSRLLFAAPRRRRRGFLPVTHPQLVELLETRLLLAADYRPFLDINAQQSANESPTDLPQVTIDSTTFFADFRPQTGIELWKTDGTTEGTVLVADLNPGSDSSGINWMTNLNGVLLFTADGGEIGNSLWKSDGTAAGTTIVKDIVPGESDYLRSLVNVNGTLFLTAYDPAYGNELWKSDGTAGGTVLVSDINPGVDSSTPFYLTNVGGTLLFGASDPTTGDELWTSDGTDSGTVLVRDIFPGPDGSSLVYPVVANGLLYFTADDGTNGSELWRSDGTTGGTSLVSDINAGSDPSAPGPVTEVNGDLYFYAFDGTDHSVWKSDGTGPGTTLLKSISPTIDDLVNVNGTLYFTADDAGYGLEVWKSDGTTGGTSVLLDIVPGADGSQPDQLMNLNGTLFFTADDPDLGRELWRSEGTAGSTWVVKDIHPGRYGSSPEPVINANGFLLFNAIDETGNRQLWTSDGTGVGTRLLKEIDTSNQSSAPRQFLQIGSTLYFTASDGVHGEELWKTDGTVSGTKLVKDIRPGSSSSYPTGLTDVGGILYFTATHPSFGREIWRSDGTAAGTLMVTDLQPGVGSRLPADLTNVNGSLYFTATHPSYGRELWITDGTPGGTLVVADIASGGVSSNPSKLINVAGTLFFVAQTPASGQELWTTDGTAPGTTMVREIFAGTTGAGISALTNVNGTLLFRANDGTYGGELWTSDGTAGGTVMVRDIFTGAGSAMSEFAPPMVVVSGMAYFLADDGIAGNELWRSDGTTGGTVLVKDTHAGPYGGVPAHLVNVGGTLFFTAENAFDNTELWSSDGTEAGTTMVRDIAASNGSNPTQLTNVNGMLFFSANDRIHGRQLWVSDGTGAGTLPARGTDDTNLPIAPETIVEFLGRGWFAGASDLIGDELFEVLTTADYGDAAFSTTFADNGARHLPGGIRLGSLIDAEDDGTPSADADADDISGAADEDGVHISPLLTGQISTITVDIQNAEAGGYVDAWIDFDNSGSWESSEQIVDSQAVFNGIHEFSFTVPTAATANTVTARVRVSRSGNLSPTGWADSGEVEDLPVIIQTNLDVILPTANGADSFELRRNGDTLEVENLTTSSVTTHDLAYIHTVTLLPAPGESNTITLDFSAGGLFGLPGEITMTGDSAGDTLILKGPLQSFFEQSEPAELSGKSQIQITAGSASEAIRFEGVDSLQIQGFELGRMTGPVRIGSTSQEFTLSGPLVLGAATSFSGGQLTADGLITLATGNRLSGNGTVTGRFAGDIGSQIVATGPLTIGDALSTAGFVTRGELETGANTVTLQDQNQAVLGSLTVLGDGVASDGTVVAVNGAVVEFGNNVTGRGTLNTPSDAAKPLLVNGSIMGESVTHRIVLPGYIKGVGTLDLVDITGTYSPGLSPTTAFAGDVLYNSSSRTILEIGGLTSGSFDQINHSATATLGGTLEIQLINSFVPSIGNSFTLMTAAAVVGSFDSTDLPALPSSRGWQIEITSTQVIARVVLAPPAAPTISGPGASTTSQRPMITWNAVEGADDYDIWIANQSTGVNPSLTASVSATSFTPDSDLGIGRFNLWVRASNAAGDGAWTSQYNFTIETRASVQDPGRTLNTARPTLTWDPIPGAVRYDLWINDKVAGISQVVREENLTTTSWTADTDLPLGLYHAWVRGIAADDTAGIWSPTVLFYAIPSPTVTAGMNSTFDRTPTFAWDALTGAAKYEVYISDRAVGTFPAYLYQTNITGTSFTPASDMPDGLYRVWIIGVSAVNVRSFWTDPMDIYIGGRTDVLTPTGTTSDTTPTFTWRPVDGADHYDLWVDQIDGTQQIIRQQTLTSTDFTPS